MKILISERLSQNKYKTPEGYLVCVDAILSRTGKQQYQKRELFQDCQDSDADMIIDVNRSDKEVFSEQAMASFENKPVTIEHPSEYVTPDNFNELSVGYLRDIRKGTYAGKPVMLGTLVLTNAEVIEKVESGELTNLSCGYDAECIETTSGYEFVNIRGNHIALCETPRAGITHIVDSVVNDVEFKHLTEAERELKAALGLYRKVNGSHTRKPGQNEDKQHRQNQYNNDQVAELNEAINEAIQNLAKGIKDKRAWQRLSTKLEAWEQNLDYKEVAKKANQAIKKFMNYIKDSNNVDEFLQYGHGLQLEDESIAFYEALKERFPEHTATIQDILNEELKHVGQLNELREKINARINKEIDAGKQEAIKDDSMKLDGLTREEKELCDYMLENALDDDKDENDLLRKMKAYYSEYSNLARRKSNDVLNYFKQHINDSMKVHDGILEEGKTYITRNGNKLTVKKLYAGYSDYDGQPTLQVNYAYQKTDGKKGTSRCSSYDFFNMMRDKVYDSIDVNDNILKRNKIIAEANDSSADADKLLRKLRKEFESGDILADDELEIICKQAHINTSTIQDLVAVGKLKEHGSNSYMIKDTSINDDDESQFELELKRAIERNSKKFSSDIKPSVANKVAKKLGYSIGYTTQSKEYLHKYLYILDACDNKTLIDCLTRAYKKQIRK